MVYHVLKNGTVKTDITGHVVKYSDVPQIYDVVRRLESRSVLKQKEKKEVLV